MSLYKEDLTQHRFLLIPGQIRVVCSYSHCLPEGKMHSPNIMQIFYNFSKVIPTKFNHKFPGIVKEKTKKKYTV
jgi:hypothetical protein